MAIKIAVGTSLIIILLIVVEIKEAEEIALDSLNIARKAAMMPVARLFNWAPIR